MRITRIEIERFLGFKQLSIDVDPKLQLIAGPNNAGKSSLLRMVEAFFSDPLPEDLLALKPLNDYYVSGGPRMKSSIQIHFGDLSSREVDTFGEAALPNNTFWVRISCTRTGKIDYSVSQNLGNPQDFYLRVLESYSFVKIPSVRVGGNTGDDNDQSLIRLYETLESVLVRAGGARQTQLQKRFDAVIAPMEKLVHEILSESVGAIATELPFRERELGIKLPDSRHALRGMLGQASITSRDEIEVPISERGTGFQSALVLGILRYVASRNHQSGANVVFAIEEPEAFLHPQTQRAMAKILRDISADAQLLVTTHSAVLVDSFSVQRISRLPLGPEGVVHASVRQDLSVAEEGRLTRYCDATNSELIFANAVILVEGYGDKLLIDHLLGRVAGGPGGHYAAGIAVIEASSIDNIPHLLRLAEYFSVRAYVLTDKDGVHKAGGNGRRKLFELLKERKDGPSSQVISQLHPLADVEVKTLKAALEQQSELNKQISEWDAFVLASDLEGLLLDTVGQKKLAALLGPDGEAQIDASTALRFSNGARGKADMASWLGSKGWNSNLKHSNKAKPHLPSALLRTYLDTRPTVPQAVRPLEAWLSTIIATHHRSPL